MSPADIVILILAVAAVAGGVAYGIRRRKPGGGCGGCHGCSGGGKGCGGCGRSSPGTRPGPEEPAAEERGGGKGDGRCG
ncbi:MAG TPA: hypothetical protein H9674_09960 [Firmicutes bacterium]|nr:hypothetical protein [Bacillota bacterium]